uniref:Protein fem-1 homolog C-like n=1 Tax=Sinocyclocheilus rhinocerous TaxID=307959 RepID=A0A673HUW2_9TELE
MDLKSAVFNAARDGKLRLLQKLLENKSDHDVMKLMAEKTNGATPLLMAARYGHLELVEYLIECCCASVEVGGSVNFDGEIIEGAPPLWAASAAGHLKVVQSLLGHGASVNNTTLTNSTPLRAACFDGHLDIVRYLVEHKADLEVANRHGHTCLMISCYKGHKEIAQYLLEKGADVNRKSVKGNTALHDCAESGSLEIMKMLLKYGSTMEKDGYGMTPLLSASVTGQSLSPFAKPPDNITSMPLLSNNNNTETCRKLIHTCNISVIYSLSEIKLVSSGQRGWAISYRFRYTGKNSSHDENKGPCTRSPKFSYAFFRIRHPFLSKCLLLMRKRRKSNLRSTHTVPNRYDSQVLSIILHLICLLEKVPCTVEQDHFKKETIYKFLKLQACGKNGFSPLHLAVDRNTTCVGRYPVCKFPSFQVASILLECGADVNCRDEDDNSPLHVAASNNHPDIMNLLISCGTHFDSTNSLKQTACDLLDQKELAKNLIQPINHTTLQCLAARAIIKHGLAYRGNIPERLEAFVLLHR